MTPVLDYLRSGRTLDDLTAEKGVIVKRHPRYNNLCFLKYHQIDSPMGDPVVQDCRGIILDEDNNWSVVSFPFRKFFNAYETHAAQIDWSTATVYEKLDGSLMTLYWYDGAWQVASNGLPDAGGPLPSGDGTFADLFWETWWPYRLPVSNSFCFMFELTAPENRVVVSHALPKLTALGARCVNESLSSSFCEVRPLPVYNWQCVATHPLTTLEDCLTAANALPGHEAEGYVVCDANFNRIKIKSPAYVALHHLISGMSERRMVELVRTGEAAEAMAYFPELKGEHDRIAGAMEAMADELDADYARLCDIAEQKNFAQAAMQTRCPHGLFAIRNGKASDARDWLKSIHVDRVCEMVEKGASRDGEHGGGEVIPEPKEQ